MVEDPLLAVAQQNMPKASESPYLSRFGPTSPLAPVGAVYAVKEPEQLPVIDTFIDEDTHPEFYKHHDDLESEIPEQEPILAHAHLVTHAKVYALADQ